MAYAQIYKAPESICINAWNGVSGDWTRSEDQRPESGDWGPATGGQRAEAWKSCPNLNLNPNPSRCLGHLDVWAAIRGLKTGGSKPNKTQQNIRLKMHLQLNSINFQSISFNDSEFMSGHKRGSPRDAMGTILFFWLWEEGTSASLSMVIKGPWASCVCGICRSYLLSPAVRGNAN